MKAITIIVALILLIAGITFFASKSNYFATQGADSTAAAIRVPGVVEANEVTVSARIGGRIQKLSVDEGSMVQENAVIAVLDRDELAAERRQQEALIQQLSVKLDQAKEMVVYQQESTQGMLARAQAQLQVLQSQRQQAQAELDQLRKDLDRGKALVEADSMTRQEYERELTAVQTSEAKIRALEDQATAAKAEIEVSQANRRHATAARQEVAETEALLKQAQAQLSQTITRLGYTELRAPLAGMVSLRVAAQGEMVRPGDPIVTIVDLDDVWVKAGVEESFLGGDLIGRTMPVQLASGEELQGKVTTVSATGAFATQRDVDRVKRDIRTFDLKLRLPNPNHTVRPGMTAYIYLPKTAATADRDTAAKSAFPSKNQ